MVWTLSPSLLFLPLVELDYRIFMHTEKKKKNEDQVIAGHSRYIARMVPSKYSGSFG